MELKLVIDTIGKMMDFNINRTFMELKLPNFCLEAL
jgi:hypothetical protein